MTREIKFRCWDTIEKEMRETAMLRWENGEMTRIAGYWKTTRDNGWTDYDPKSGKYILMQFTGLKDKNGKEVYEGDIVTGTSFTQRRDCSGRVVFEKGSFWLYDITLRSLIGELSDIEVIGNIYENPELLK